MLEIVFLVVGVTLRANWMQHQYKKIVEHLDQEIPQELKFHENLSKSLLQDLLW